MWGIRGISNDFLRRVRCLLPSASLAAADERAARRRAKTAHAQSALVPSSATSPPMRLLVSPKLAQPPSLRVSPTMAAAPEVQAAFAAVMLLSVSHGLLPQPKVQGKQPQCSSSQKRTAPGSRRPAARPRTGKPRLCEEEPLSVDEGKVAAVQAAEEMTAMEYVTFFGYIAGFLAFFYAIGAATSFFS